MILGLRTVIYHTDNLDDAKAWYTKLIGHPPYFDQPFYVGFNVGGYELGLLPDGEGVATYWGVVNIDDAFQRLLALGAKPKDAITDVGDGIKVASVVDPFGNVVGIIENPHFRLDDGGQKN
jgi:predicted enzyme related to lactoylglutathione lyase